MVVLQLKWNSHNSLKLKRYEQQKQLYLKIYDMISDRVRVASSALAASAHQVRWVPMALDNFWFSVKELKLEPVPITARVLDLRAAHSTAMKSLIDLTFALEKYEIAAPALKRFSTWTGHDHKLLSESHSAFCQLAGRFLPFDMQDGKASNPVAPNPEDLAELKKRADAYQEQVFDYVGYLTDLNRGLQNLLLGDIFGNRISPRIPQDPSVKVLDFSDITKADRRRAKQIQKTSTRQMEGD